MTIRPEATANCASPDPMSAGPAVRVAGGARFTVLLGDEADAAEAWHRTARGLLAAQGVQTLVARTGREALGLIEASALGRGQRIHVAVLEQRMPMMGGLQILRRLHQDLEDLHQRIASGALPASDRVPAAPVPPYVPPAILLADRLAAGTMHEALSMHVFSVLPKPIELNLLLDTLARALQRFYQNKWPEARRE